jgi:hypothetical protein
MVGTCFRRPDHRVHACGRSSDRRHTVPVPFDPCHAPGPARPDYHCPAVIGDTCGLAAEQSGGLMPMSVDEVRRVLRTLDDLRYSAGDLDAALRRIVEATHKLFAVDGAGLMLIDPEQLLRNAALSDQRVDEVETLQIEHGDEGPCVDGRAAPACARCPGGDRAGQGRAGGPRGSQQARGVRAVRRPLGLRLPVLRHQQAPRRPLVQHGGMRLAGEGEPADGPPARRSRRA